MPVLSNNRTRQRFDFCFTHLAGKFLKITNSARSWIRLNGAVYFCFRACRQLRDATFDLRVDVPLAPDRR